MTAADAILSNQNVAGAQHECFSIASSEFESAAQSNDVLALRRFMPIERRMCRRFLELNGYDASELILSNRALRHVRGIIRTGV